MGYRDGNTVIKDMLEGLANSAVVGRLVISKGVLCWSLAIHPLTLFSIFITAS